MTIEGGEETELLTDIGGGGWPDWALGPSGVYYLKYGKFPQVSINFYEFAGERTIPILTLDKGPGWGLSLSNDGKSIVYIENEFSESHLMLVKNFG